MKTRTLACLLTPLLLLALGAGSARAAVTHWRIIKGAYYLQDADNTPAATTTNWGIYGVVETALPGDAASVVIEGGNISSPIAYEWDEDEWVLDVSYTNKAAMDAVFPSSSNFSIILSGGSLGTITQQVYFSADAYPNVPYLTGADYSGCLALEALEPFELNWVNAGTTTTVSLQINTGSELDEGDTLFEIYSNDFTSVEMPWNLFAANSNYNGYIDFANANLQSGANAFGINGDVSFNTSLGFYINPVNSAVAYDDFNDNDVNTNLWEELLTEPGKNFSEDNGRLEFISGSGPDGDSVAWTYDTDSLTYTQDWSVAVDMANFIDSSTLANPQEIYFSLVVATAGLDDLILIENYMEPSYSELFTVVDVNGVEDVLNASVQITEQQFSLKISFDADTKRLTSAYSFGGDYTVLTNVSTAGWGLSDSDVFLAALSCGTESLTVTSGQVYADNFRIYDGKVLSNEVDMVELEFLHSYGDGPISPPNSLFATNNFLQDNFIKVWADTTHRVRDITFTTSSGFNATVSDRWDDGQALDWEVEIPLGFSTTWNPADDGDWTVTFGFFDGTYQSTIIPFMKEDGTTPLPNLFYSPTFLPPSPLNHSVTNETTWSFAWAAAGPNVNHLSLDEIFGDDETGEIEFLYADALPGNTESILDLTFDGPLSTTNAGPVVFGKGFHRMRINEGYAHAAHNDEGILYIVGKLNEADITFIIELDADSDNMDDTWEIEYFGGTNVVNGGAYDDFDNDGMLNIDEFISGVNPTNSSSVFAVEAPGPSPAGFVINWNAVPGREYAVYWAKTLSDGFVPVTPGYLPYPQNSYTDTVHTNEGCGFYYIDVQLQD